MDTKRILKDARLLGSAGEKELRLLEHTFAAALRTWQRQGKADRQRAPGAGQKGLLLTVREKLLFILVYLKCYPTFDVQGRLFGLERSRA